MKCPFLKDNKCPIVENDLENIHECYGYSCDSPHYVYIIKCDNDTLYTGHTNNLSRRMKEHKAGRGARYTKAHGFKVYTFLQCGDRGDAMKIERKIKSWSHDKKKSLFEIYGTYNNI